MIRYLLDTTIISNFTKPAPSESLIAWMAEQSDEDLFIASLTVAEIRRGVLEKPAGKRRDQLDAWSCISIRGCATSLAMAAMLATNYGRLGRNGPLDGRNHQAFRSGQGI